MTPRNPENSSTVDLQNRSLQDSHDPRDGHAPVVAGSKPHVLPAPGVPQEESGGAKLADDRVEAYLRGPTVFSA